MNKWLSSVATFKLYCLILLLGLSPFKLAYSYNALEECMAVSNEDDDIHVCLDNYLDIMDNNIADISDYIQGGLDQKALASFQRSQQAFNTYRKENCLWYLDFTQPRNTAEVVAKNCLSDMSQQRLSELQALISSSQTSNNVQRGYYVYGAERNSFQPCGTEKRYWVEGEVSLLAELQQDYLSKATADLQVLYVSFVGSINEDIQTYPDHAGIFTISRMNELRVLSGNDCQMPVAASAETNVGNSETASDEAAEAADEALAEDDLQIEPEQVLRAYFADWVAECIQRKTDYSCDLTVAFQGDTVEGESEPTLRLTRRSQKRTTAELTIPAREVDDPEKIYWRVDSFPVGYIEGTSILVDELSTRQSITEKKFMQDDLLPLLQKGKDISFDILESAGYAKGDTFSASLKGLSRALVFVDDFVSSGGDI